MEMNGKIFACNVIWGDDIMRPVRHRMRVKKCGHFGVNEWKGSGGVTVAMCVQFNATPTYIALTSNSHTSLLHILHFVYHCHYTGT